MLLERPRPHEETDMPAWDGLLDDLILRGSNIIGCAENLLRRLYVICLATKKVDRACYRMKIEFPAQCHEFSFRQTVLLEDLLDCLEILAARQVERMFIPAVENLLFLDVSWVVDMFVQVYMILDIMLRGMHILPTLQHAFTLHQATAHLHKFFLER